MEDEPEPFLALLEKLVVAADAHEVAEVLSLTIKILISMREESAPMDVSDDLQFRVRQIHCRALLSMSNYTDVIEFCNNLNQDDPDRLLLLVERTYALYKLGRYATCRDTILKAAKNNFFQIPQDSIRGFNHILAQCLYRLHDTSKATQMYCDLAASKGFNEDDEVITNALAASTSNNSLPISSPSINGLQKQIMDKIAELKFHSEDGHNDAEYPYEMVHNAGTHLLQTSTSLAQTKQALELLGTAEEECKAAFEKNDDGSELDLDLLKNILPIKANIALGKMQSGDLNGAMRSYLEVVLSAKQIEDKEPGFNGGGAVFAAENNLAVLNHKRGTSSSVYDLMKKLPDISSALEATPGKTTISPNQIRIILYNRAVLYQKMGKIADMRAVLKSLRSSLSPNAQSRRQVENGKKKKRKNVAGKVGNFFAITATDAEKQYWECKISILECEEGAGSHDLLEALQDSIHDAMKAEGLITFAKESYEYAIAELELYQAQKSAQKSDLSEVDTQKTMMSTLEKLPSSIRGRPATVASLCSLYRSLGMEEKIEPDSGKMAQKNLADLKLRLGMYTEAASLYEAILNDSTSALKEEEVMECTAGLVKALSQTDIEKAIDIAQDLEFDEGIDNLDGEELEGMEIPRLHKNSCAGGGSRSRTIISSRGGGAQRNKKQNREAILRRRAKKREVYLDKLQKEGKYNPERPTKPDPERWIPKNQRSYNRRGRKGRNKFLGAQGGGTGFGADKEAAKLDALARATAKAQGKDVSGGKPSTAHLSVSTSGRRRR